MTTSLYQTKIDASAPTTATVGVVGNWYIDTSTTIPTLYLCTKVTEDTSTTPSTFTYTWTEIANQSAIVTALNTPV